ncbi:hypothetical protein [Aestuariivivens sediminis]|uniref:hypothetical protein n=1 Tax=Aestuariivivens sediminis TaxID=2913557 RepID=UPI001F5A253C|nr:hypothetical protein [Aestuariivivens sediminis]
MTTNEETQVIYLLESVDLASKSGILKIKEDRKYAHWIKLKVSLSPLLLYRIKNKYHKGLSRNKAFIGTEYKSALNSTKYSENPFRLVEFVPDEYSDIPLNYRLELVFEMFSERIERLNAFHKPELVGYRNRFLKPSQYIRFIQLTVTKKKSECKRKLLFSS